MLCAGAELAALTPRCYHTKPCTHAPCTLLMWDVLNQNCPWASPAVVTGLPPRHPTPCSHTHAPLNTLFRCAWSTCCLTTWMRR